MSSGQPAPSPCLPFPCSLYFTTLRQHYFPNLPKKDLTLVFWLTPSVPKPSTVRQRIPQVAHLCILNPCPNFLACFYNYVYNNGRNCFLCINFFENQNYDQIILCTYFCYTGCLKKMVIELWRAIGHSIFNIQK